MHAFVYHMVEKQLSTKQLVPPGDRPLPLQEIPSIEQPIKTFENSNFNESVQETNQNDIEKLCEPKTPPADQIPPRKSERIRKVLERLDL